MKPYAVKGFHGAKVDIARHGLATEGPEFFEQEGRRDDGGAGIEGEAVLLEDAGAATRGAQALEHRDPVPLHRQTNGSGEPTESAANDNSAWQALVRKRTCHGMDPLC